MISLLVLIYKSNSADEAEIQPRHISTEQALYLDYVLTDLNS